MRDPYIWASFSSKSKLGQKGTKFVYYIPNVIKRSDSITVSFEVSDSLYYYIMRKYATVLKVCQR